MDSASNMAGPEYDAHCSNQLINCLSWTVWGGLQHFQTQPHLPLQSNGFKTCIGIAAVVGFVRKSSNSDFYHAISCLSVLVSSSVIKHIRIQKQEVSARSSFLGLPCCGVQPARLGRFQRQGQPGCPYLCKPEHTENFQYSH